MGFLEEFLASGFGREFVAGGFGGMAGIVSGYPLDTVRIRQQHLKTGSAFGILKDILAKEGPAALYKGMGAPLVSVSFQNAVVFQVYAVLSRALDSPSSPNEPPSYSAVTMAGVGTGVIQSIMLTPCDLVKIRLQLQNLEHSKLPNQQGRPQAGPFCIAKQIVRSEGIIGLYRGLYITMMRDAPAHGLYFWTYEYAREQFHPGCRKSSQESMTTMLAAGGLAGVSSWAASYPLDVVKTRLQSQSSPPKYNGVIDCFCKSVKEEGYRVMFRGLGTAVSRAFLVNGAVFCGYETALRCIYNKGSVQAENTKTS